MVSATHIKVKGVNGKRKSMVSATRVYKTYAEHTLLFTFQFSLFTLSYAKHTLPFSFHLSVFS